ncbi:hypothetical protein QAD02_003380 [Eretmocerus hayati]|uniref:Uncharacterized protein n=1 Tax=Eretmocerus hayati TaxID=131215 RepID=A0ACC2NMJ8_9HYME|nr:hypothetical protein QAD02_003380 [Eretmocerus hayati]
MESIEGKTSQYPVAVGIITEEFHMDDVTSRGFYVKETVDECSQLIWSLGEATFELHNSTTLSTASLFEIESTSPVLRILWSPMEDHSIFNFLSMASEEKATKRSVLSIAGKFPILLVGLHLF